jgi:hypothetical protein
MRRILWLSPIFVCAVAARGDDATEARKTLDTAVQALGGADKLAGLDSVTAKSKGKLTTDETVEFRDEWSVSGTDRLRWKVDAQVKARTVTGLMIFNTDKVWFRDEARAQSAELPKEIMPIFREDLRALRLAQQLTTLFDKKYQLSSLGELKVGERAAVGIKIAEKDRPELDLYFDKETRLPLRIEVRVKEPGAAEEATHALLFEDYKDFDGVKHFTKMTLKRDNKTTLELELIEVKRQAKLDDSVFAKP